MKPTALKPVFALTLAALTGCGVEDAESTSLQDATQSAIVLRNSGPQGITGEVVLETQVVANQFPVDALFDVTLSGAVTATDGTPAKLAIAFPSCGWWIAGTAEGAVSNGLLSVTVPGVIAATDMTGTAFVFIDHDRDGTCDTEKGDGLFEATAPAAGGNVSVATSALTVTESWYCMFFNGYGE